MRAPLMRPLISVATSLRFGKMTMSYDLNIGPLRPLTWQQLITDVQCILIDIVFQKVAWTLRIVEIVQGEETSVELSDAALGEKEALYTIYFGAGGMCGQLDLVIAKGFLRSGEKYNYDGFHGTVSILSGAEPIVYVASACFAVAMAELSKTEISDSGSIWVSAEWIRPGDFVQATRLRSPQGSIASAVQEVYRTLAWNVRK